MSAVTESGHDGCDWCKARGEHEKSIAKNCAEVKILKTQVVEIEKSTIRLEMGESAIADKVQALHDTCTEKIDSMNWVVRGIFVVILLGVLKAWMVP